MYKLYARSGAGSAAIEAVLALCGARFEIVDVAKRPDGGPPEWFLAINPRGEVPALKLPDDTIMTESAAMVIHLADCFPAANLAPAPGTTSRAVYLRAILSMAANVYATDLRMYYPERFSTDTSHAPAIKAKAIIDLNRDYDAFNAMLGTGPFIAGATMSAADVYAAMLISWSEDFEQLSKRLPKLRALYDAVAAVPLVRKVWDRNAMP
jgi:glutathione S-transferase